MRIAKPVVLIAFAFLFAAAPQAFSQDDHDDGGALQVGYAVVTPVLPTTGGLAVFETFGLKKTDATEQAGLGPGQLITSATLYAGISTRLGRDLGIAITNPNDKEAQLTFTLRREDGFVIGSPQTLFIPGRRQISRFVTQLFTGLPSEINGTLEVSSTLGVVVVALRFRGTAFSTEPLFDTAGGGTLPEITAGVGGAGSFILPHFAAGSGWATEIVIVNTTEVQASVRVDFFKQDGSPMTVRLNGSSRTTFFNLTLQAGGVFTLAPRDANGDSRF